MESNHPTPYNIEEIERWTDWDRRYIWHPFTQMQDYVQQPPLIISHGEGAYLYDIQGRRYFDGNSSLWVCAHGHGRREITQAIQRQAEKISHSTLLGQANIPSIELAKRLVEIAPPGLEKVFYSDNGSTAAEIALKMAFQYWRQARPPRSKKKTFLSIHNAYHGDTIGAVSVGGIDLFHGIFGPLLFSCCAIPYPVYSKYTSIEPPQTIAQKSLDACERLLRERAAEIAAVIVEPMMQGAAGILTQAPGFLIGLRDLCRRYEVFLIFDEVATGFGRTGKMFACEHEGVSPDFMCLAKGLTGGYLPLAATLTTQEVFDGFLGEYGEFRAFFHGHTFTGNQLGCAAALASLDCFEKDQTLQRLQPIIAHLERRLDCLFETNDRVADIRQIGMAAGIDLASSRVRNESYRVEDALGAKVCFALRNYGIWLRPLGNTLVLMPPLIATIEEIDYLIDSIDQCMKEELT
ncbi:MAG: adenosylmethionine--8-amino-7-oxononanoate transaminase [Candidatus Omnitrophota bacterium]